MDRQFSCLLFIDPKAVLSLKNDGNYDQPGPKGYAWFFPRKLKATKYPHVIRVFSENGLQDVWDKLMVPPSDAVKFEAVEFTINFDAVHAESPIRISCSNSNLALIRRSFRKSRQVQFFETLAVFQGAIRKSCFDLLKSLLTVRPDMPLRKSEDKTLLHFALERGHPVLLDLLFDCGADVNRRRGDGLTPLHVAIKAGHEHRFVFVQALLDKGAEVNAEMVGRFTFTPLHLAVIYDQEKMVRMLLEHEAEVNPHYDRQCCSPLEDALKMAGIEIVKLLVKRIAKDRLPSDLLRSAVELDRNDIVWFLLEEGYDPTPCLPIALRQGNLAALDLLTKFGGLCKYSHLELTLGLYRPIVLQRFLEYCPADTTGCDLLILVNVFNLVGSAEAVFYFFNPLTKIWALEPKFGFHFVKDFLSANRCEKEAESLNETIDHSITYRDVLSADVYCVSQFAKNTRVVEAMELGLIGRRFPLFSNLLSCKFRMGCWLRDIMEGAVPVLRVLFSQFSPLPDEVLDMIMRYLSHRDLIILEKCLPDEYE